MTFGMVYIILYGIHRKVASVLTALPNLAGLSPVETRHQGNPGGNGKRRGGLTVSLDALYPALPSLAFYPPPEIESRGLLEASLLMKSSPLLLFQCGLWNLCAVHLSKHAVMAHAIYVQHYLRTLLSVCLPVSAAVQQKKQPFLVLLFDAWSRHMLSC